MSATVSVNGRVTNQRDAVISVFDHGFLYGEGIYETIRTYNRRPFLYERHMRRLRNSAAMLVLDLPFTDDQLAAEISRTMGATTLDGEAYIRVLVTRGIGDLSYDPSATPTPSVIIIVKPQVDPPPEAYSEGVEIAIVSVVRNHPDTVSPLIKSNNLLNSALGMQEALRRGAFEGLMRNYQGELTECTTSNIFVVRSGTVITPPLDAGLLAGITRGFIFDIGAHLGIGVREGILRDEDLFTADEAFLTSTTREVVPVVKVDGKTIGPGSPGPVTAALLAEFRRRARAT